MLSVLEKQYVQDFYNTYASEFDSTRYSTWPIVKNFIDSIPEHSHVLDVGSGNGKNQYRNDLNWTSCDNSIEMCNRSRNPHLCECTNLPFQSNMFDYVI
jgi:SAM-dependent methyltransferase